MNIATRVKNAIHVLMGWPLMSGVCVKDGVVTIAPEQKHVRIVNCVFASSHELTCILPEGEGQP